MKSKCVAGKITDVVTFYTLQNKLDDFVCGAELNSAAK
jgi:hypothetical protein